MRAAARAPWFVLVPLGCAPADRRADAADGPATAPTSEATGAATGAATSADTSETTAHDPDPAAPPDAGGTSTSGDGPPVVPSCYAASIPYTSALTFPDHTRWGDNMHKIGRVGARAFSYWSDNSGYCVPNAPPGTPSCAPGESGLSFLRVLRQDEPGAPWLPVPALAFPTVRPGNLLVTPQCVHAFVFEPHPQATRALDRFGGLKHYWFPPDAGDDTVAGSEWVELPPLAADGPETANLRIGASIAPDGRMVSAWGLGNTMQVRVRDGAGCSPGTWDAVVAEGGLDFGYMYPRVHVAGGAEQQYYTGLVAQMDHQTPTVCASGPVNAAGDSIYRKANYWEDSRDGTFRRETVFDAWDPCSDVARVNHTEMYIDRASRSHVVFAKIGDGGGTLELEHWFKPGDSFATDPAFDQAPHCDDAMPCAWSGKLRLDWGRAGINWVRLFEIAQADGGTAVHYVASSWNRVFVSRFDGADKHTGELVELVLPAGWTDALAGTGLFISAAGGGTSVDESQLDILLPGAEVTYHLRVDKLALAAAWADGAVPEAIACTVE